MILLDYRGGGATRKTGSCCGLDLCHSEDKDNSSPKIEEFYEKMKRHSGLAAKSVETESKRDFMPLPGDPESINADRTDSGSGAGVTKAVKSYLLLTVILSLTQNLSMSNPNFCPRQSF